MNKIVIHKSPTADSRTAKGRVSKDQLLESSRAHIGDVQRTLDWMCRYIRKIGDSHDYTKVTNLDSFYDSFVRSLGKSPEENTFTQEPWYQNHITKERHHLNDHVPDNVNLFDVLERIADITTAGLARSGKVHMDELDPDLLLTAYKNTIKLLVRHMVVKPKL